MLFRDRERGAGRSAADGGARGAALGTRCAALGALFVFYKKRAFLNKRITLNFGYGKNWQNSTHKYKIKILNIHEITEKYINNRIQLKI